MPRRHPSLVCWSLTLVMGLSMAAGTASPAASQNAFGAPPALTVSMPAAGTAVRITQEVFTRLPRQAITTRVPWADGVRRYEGVLARDLLKDIGAAGTTVRATALNDYVVEIPMADLERHDVLIVDRIDGQPVPVRKMGPFMVMYPFDADPGLRTDLYYARCIWQLAALEIR